MARPLTDDTERSTGLDLKVERVRARVTNLDLAAAMGVSSSRLSKIEAQDNVTDRLRVRYLTALETCRTSGTETAA